jgi:anti-anti-sigma factor
MGDSMKPDAEISVKNIKKFYAEISEELKKGSELAIDLSGVKRVDLAAVQVIIAAGRKARDMKKVVRLTGVSPEMKKLLGLSGIKV